MIGNEVGVFSFGSLTIEARHSSELVKKLNSNQNFKEEKKSLNLLILLRFHNL